MEEKNRQALGGLKILDFSWVIAGPLATKYLGDHGATVIRVESKQRLDILRPYPPYPDGIPGINRSGSFTTQNSSKYGIALNLNCPEGRELAKRLVAWSDIVVENFLPGQMERWGLAYENLKEVKPEIIMIRASMQGQTGPYARQPGFGTMLQGSSGFTHFVSWPDRAPTGSTTPWTDYSGAWIVVIAIMSALDYRRRTARGQCIDISQLEAAIPWISSAILDYTANGRVQSAIGNRHPYASPHGAYRCKGEDRWCVIAVFTDEEWEAFYRVTGNEQWVQDLKFATLLARKKNEDYLDYLIEQWTVQYSPEEVMALMQNAGVAAGIIEDGRDLHLDPQLKHRDHFWMLDHPEMGITAYDSPSFRMSKTPAKLKMSAPCVGQHTEYICREIIGMQDDEFVNLLNKGVFE